ncbi:50S ribosomal protein L16 [Candidatus Woesearchaeota archaeon]|nr:50S ribosomal protein L16 [Candidatus Woesearchaeota archaeon]
MARIRKFSAYRKIERPYTRVSKYKNKSFIRMNPNPRVVSFENGNLKRKFDFTLELKSKSDLQIRDHALESARQTSNRTMEKGVGTNSYHLKIKPYPYHILRENPIAAGAGADRFSTGMKKSFGKPIGLAAQIKKGQTVFQISVNAANTELAKNALLKASKKLPCSCTVELIENKMTENK